MATNLMGCINKDEPIDSKNINRCMKDFLGKINGTVTKEILLRAVGKALDYWEEIA